MKTHFLLLINFFIFLSLLNLSAQEIVHDKLILKSGDIYVGEIILKTDEVVILQTTDGTRYQFPFSDIKEISKSADIFPTENISSNNDTLSFPFCAFLEFTGGVAQAKNKFDLSPNSQITLIFGKKQLFNKGFFIGGGIGYNNTSLEENNSLNFLPIFIRLEDIPIKKRLSPYMTLDAGYAFALASDYSGGTMTKISGGITYKLTYKTIVFSGIYAGIQNFKGLLTETNANGTFSYEGITTMKQVGIKLGLQF